MIFLTHINIESSVTFDIKAVIIGSVLGAALLLAIIIILSSCLFLCTKKCRN